jgi:anti-anti-sigma factor
MKITERFVDDIVVLDLKGSWTLDAGDNPLAHALMRLMDQGRAKFVINLARVPYLDSSGGGDLSRSYRLVRSTGSSMVLLDPTTRILDWLNSTKLLSVFTVCSEEREALLNLAGPQEYLEVDCPLCDKRVRCGSDGFATRLHCRLCGAMFECSESQAPELGQTRMMSVTLVWLPTYERDGVQLWFKEGSGDCTLYLPQRCDRFAFEVVERLWSLIPRPRRMFISSRDLQEISAVAVAKLIDLCRESDGDRVVLHVPASTDRHLAQQLDGVPLVVQEWEEIQRLVAEGGMTQQAPKVTVTRVFRS